MEKSITKDPEPIVLTQLVDKFDDAITQNKYTTVIDDTSGAENFLKYRGSVEFALSEKDMTAENLGEKYLRSHTFGTMWTLHFTDLPYKNIFDKDYFPEDLLNPAWGTFENIDGLRKKFGSKFPEIQKTHPEFKMVFLFYKADTVPDILWQRTKVIQVFKKEDIEEVIKKREEAAEASKKKQEEEKKVDVKSAAPKSSASGTGSGSKTTTTASKTTTGSGDKKTATTTTTTASKTTTSSTGSKTTTTTATKAGTSSSSASKTVSKK